MLKRGSPSAAALAAVARGRASPTASGGLFPCHHSALGGPGLPQGSRGSGLLGAAGGCRRSGAGRTVELGPGGTGRDRGGSGGTGKHRGGTGRDRGTPRGTGTPGGPVPSCELLGIEAVPSAGGAVGSPLPDAPRSPHTARHRNPAAEAPRIWRMESLCCPPGFAGGDDELKLT